jgi:alpha-D-xyloside xylohydrolase
MFGDSLLVSPIMNESGDAEYYLPDCGIWTDIISGEKLSGGRYINKKYDYFGLPLLAKPNSIIPFGKSDFEYDYLDETEFVIYEIEDGKEISFDIYNTAAEKIFTITAKREDEKVIVTNTDTDKKFTVKLSSSDDIYIV